jgi:hypothetical protein
MTDIQHTNTRADDQIRLRVVLGERFEHLDSSGAEATAAGQPEGGPGLVEISE